MKKPSLGKDALNPEKWVDKHADYLFSYAISRVGMKELAEDLTQETFLSAYKARNSYRGDSSERTWLISILKRKIIDHYRKTASKKEAYVEDFNYPFKKEGFFKGHWEKERGPKTWIYDHEELWEKEEILEILKLCLSYLPEQWAAVITLKILEEIETDDVCKEIGITPSNLWVIIHRVKLRLRECMEQKLT